MGRNTGSRNVGYFFRTGRGWYTKVGDPINGPDGKPREDAKGKVQLTWRMVALADEDGQPLRKKSTLASVLKAAHGRVHPKNKNIIAAPADSVNSITVEEVCDAYLAQVKADGALSTYQSRGNTLFDLCHGLPARFRPCDDPAKPRAKPIKGDYIHKGLGSLAVSQLLPIHLDRWLQKHPTWDGSRRTHIQAVKRALNYGVESGLLATNPLRGYKTPKPRGRVTCLTPEQEVALCEAANPEMRMALKVCIRTGARPGCEFANLTAKHVKDLGARMECIFKPDDSKTGKQRTIRISDPATIETIRAQMKLNPKGPLFRNTKGDAWTRTNLSEGFRRLVAKLSQDKIVKGQVVRKAIEFDDDVCVYSCRHTYAKRVLAGHWSGKTTNIETLAALMGNSPQVCRDHYLQFCEHYSEPLWESS